MAKNDNKQKKHFFKDLKTELKKVVWPTPKQLFNSTVAVITIVLVCAVIVFLLDIIFEFGNKYGITNLQSIVNEKFNKDEQSNENTDNNSVEATEGEENSENGEGNAEPVEENIEVNNSSEIPESNDDAVITDETTENNEANESTETPTEDNSQTTEQNPESN